MVVRFPTTERREDGKEKLNREVGSKDKVEREREREMDGWMDGGGERRKGRGVVRIEGRHLLAK